MTGKCHKTLPTRVHIAWDTTAAVACYMQSGKLTFTGYLDTGSGYLRFVFGKHKFA